MRAGRDANISLNVIIWLVISADFALELHLPLHIGGELLVSGFEKLLKVVITHVLYAARVGNRELSDHGHLDLLVRKLDVEEPVDICLEICQCKPGGGASAVITNDREQLVNAEIIL